MLTDEQRARYQRNIVVTDISERGQELLLGASVLVVGAGGLGSPVLLYLAAAGIGRLGIIDSDVIDLSNLQRQVIHDTPGIGSSKVDSAKARVQRLNPDVDVTGYQQRLEPDNAGELIAQYDVIVDATDNFGSRYLLSDWCVRLNKPFVHGAVYRFDGQLTVFCTDSGPCYRCIFPRPPEPGTVLDAAQAGVISPLPGVIGTMQAVEVIKLITDAGEPLIGRMLLYDGLRSSASVIAINRNPDCRCTAAGEICRDDPLYRY